MPVNHREELKEIRTFPSLVKYLRDEMGWPIEGESFEEITFDYTPEELGIDFKNAVKIEEIKRLRPLSTNQPWGIFFIKFAPGRLPVVALRRILSRVALKKRASANSAERAAWKTDDLLFISNYGEGSERHITFAHFSQDSVKNDLPTLKVLGWDNLDTPLHLDHVSEQLRHVLGWPKDASNAEEWRKTWRSAFVLRHREVIKTSENLSIQLAHLARAIRDRITSALAIETESGPLTKLMKAFKEALVHDLDADGFADMYAQTIAYGLLSARISNPNGATADELATQMPVTNPFLKELMETFLQVGGRRSKKGGPNIDFDELGVSEIVELLDDAKMDDVLRDFGDKNPEEDPVIHFYELFLKEYDAKKRMQRGVFYTPRPVVSYIVRSVDELLRTEFKLPDGLADITTWGEMAKRNPDLKIPEGTNPEQAFVQILDPATGTGTFLVEVIDIIFKTMAEKWDDQGHSVQDIETLWNEYVPKHLLPRLHGYELLMAPYAIAHLKIGLKLFETGYKFINNERTRVYLTNALEPSSNLAAIGAANLFIALGHEAQAVNIVKQCHRFTVVLGNPPYSHTSSNLTPSAMALVEPYKYINNERIQERGALSLQKNLQDDYIKFIRLAELSIESSGLGIVGIITNNSYLDSRSFRGMRFNLSQTFNACWILDLHGSGKKEETVLGDEIKDENVFDILQGVSISILTRSHNSQPSGMHKADLLGPREIKYNFLNTKTITNTSYASIQLAPPFYIFVKQDLELLKEYQAFEILREIFPVYSSGIKTHRDDFAYAFTKEETKSRLQDFCDKHINDQDLRDRFGLKDTNVWALHEQRRRVKLPTLLDDIQPALYRPFDIRTTCFSDEIIELTRKAVMNHMTDGNNIALLCSQQQAEEGFRHIFCTRLISDWGAVSNKTRESTSAFPLRLTQNIDKNTAQADLGILNSDHPNVNQSWLKLCGSPENVFYAIYSLLYAPSYRGRYASFLRSDFPRLPEIKNIVLLENLIRLGKELVGIHLLESPSVV